MTEKKRLLFVDDDPGVLAGLENVLHRDRRRWDMVFALGGEAAIAEVRKSTFDVVISDMRMPVVDGAKLLEIVRVQSPATARIMLSGSDCETVSIPGVELLSKPCSAAMLRAAIERVLAA